MKIASPINRDFQRCARNDSDLWFAEFAEAVEEGFHVVGDWGFEFYHFIGSWVFKFDSPCVERGASDDGILNRLRGAIELPGVDEFSAIHVVCDDGVFDVSEVDSNLVGASCFW